MSLKRLCPSQIFDDFVAAEFPPQNFQQPLSTSHAPNKRWNQLLVDTTSRPVKDFLEDVGGGSKTQNFDFCEPRLDLLTCNIKQKLGGF
jgi:hypothetical protein